MPEAAVAHDRERAPLHHRRHAGAARQAHAVAEDRVARARTARRCAKRVAADVGRDVHRADVLLRELERGEHRPLRAADAELRRPRRQRRVEPLRDGGAARRGCRRASARAASGTRSRQVAVRELRAAPRAITSTVYSPAAGSRSLPCSGVCDVAPAQRRVRSPARCTRAGLPPPPAPRACRRRSRRSAPGTSG